MQTNKCVITIDLMLIIGKYLKTNNDYINVMKSSKRYNELVAMYHFNPISDTSLFLNIETQYLYEPTDMKIPKVKRYIYLYSTQELRDTLEMNESILLCNAKKYIYNQEQTLENWSGKEVDRVIYDSEIDGEESTIFRSRILNHNYLYFIFVDSDNNVFGHYLPCTINRFGYKDSSKQLIDDNIFVFSLYSNGRCKTSRYLSNNKGTFVYIYNNNNYCFCGGGYFGYRINEIGERSSSIDYGMSQCFKELNPCIFTGSCVPNRFVTKRIIVIEMK